jgi:hypothetical protein
MKPDHIGLRLFLTCWLVFGLHFATNTVREIYPALSLGDRLSFDVSEYLGLHPDIFEILGRGAFINNNPGASMMGAIPYALARPVIVAATQRVQALRAAAPGGEPQYDSVYPMAREFYRRAYERGLDVKFGLAAGVMQVWLMAPLAALSVVVMYRLLLSLTRRLLASVLLALLYGFGTPILYRTAQLNQNVLIAFCALFAFALLWQPVLECGSSASARRTAPRPWAYLLAGLLAGWAIVLDYSGVIVLAMLTVYAIWKRAERPAAARSRGDLPLFVLGAAASLAVLLAYQWIAFGNPLFPAQRYMPPTEWSRYGYNGMDWPHLDLLWQTAFSPRFGLFTSAPLLLLSLYPPAWRKAMRIVGLREAWTIFGFTVAFFLFCAGNQYGRLQFNSGVRYIVPVVPFLFLIVAGSLLKWSRSPRRGVAWLAAGFAVVTAYWSWALAMYRDVEQGRGIIEAIIAMSTHGVRLPWLTTLQNLSFVPAGPWVWLILIAASAVVAVLWWAPVPRRTRAAEARLAEK